MRATHDQPNREVHDATVYVAAFASAAVFNILFHVIPDVLRYVGAPEKRTIVLALISLAFGAALLLARPPRQAFAWVFTLTGPVVLAAWFLLKNTYRPTPVSILMGTALLPLGVTLVGAFRLASVWKLAIAAILGAALGELLAHRLRDAVGPEATWLLAAALASAAALAQSPVGQGRFRWPIAFLTAAAAVMFAAIQIKLEPMRLEWHLPSPKPPINATDY